jgi:hypothetical protein
LNIDYPLYFMYMPLKPNALFETAMSKLSYYVSMSYLMINIVPVFSLCFVYCQDSSTLKKKMLFEITHLSKKTLFVEMVTLMLRWFWVILGGSRWPSRIEVSCLEWWQIVSKFTISALPEANESVGQSRLLEFQLRIPWPLEAIH